MTGTVHGVWSQGPLIVVRGAGRVSLCVPGKHVDLLGFEHVVAVGG